MNRLLTMHSLHLLFFRQLLVIITAIVFLSGLASAACKVKAIFVQPPGEVPEQAVLVVGKQFFELELPKRNLSAAVELPSGVLTVGVLPSQPAQPELPSGAPSFQIPESWTHCILLFFHDPSNKVFPARVIPVNASSADFPLGHTVMFNVTSSTVLAKFGAEVIQVKPGQSGKVRPTASADGDYPIAIDCIYPNDKNPIAICRSTWPLDKNARQIIFVTPIPNQKVPRVWGVLDRPAVETKAKGG